MSVSQDSVSSDLSLDLEYCSDFEMEEESTCIMEESSNKIRLDLHNSQGCF